MDNNDDEKKEIGDEKRDLTENDKSGDQGEQQDQEEDRKENLSEIHEFRQDKNIYKKNNPKKRSNGILGVVSFICIGSILCGVAIGFSFGFGTQVAKNFLSGDKTSQQKFEFPSPSQNITSDKTSPSAKPNTDFDTSMDTASLIDSVSKSVVAIDTVGQRTYGFFGEPINQSGAGSGVIFSQDDKKIYIVTNQHVIKNAEDIKIKLEGSDNKIKANLIGQDESSDLAVICFDKEELEKNNIKTVKTANFGDSDSVRVGESVIAIGNAVGEGIVPSIGIVSAKNKEIEVENKTLSVMQISASINPGNSGGALINKNGEVIGITTAKYVRYAVEGMGYCIPSNDVKTAIEQIMTESEKPFLGIQGMDVSKMSGSPYVYSDNGVFVYSVMEESSADEAGLKIGDVIIKFNGKSVDSMSELQEFLGECRVGDKIVLRVLRMGSSPDIEVTLSHSKKESQQIKESD